MMRIAPPTDCSRRAGTRPNTLPALVAGLVVMVAAGWTSLAALTGGALAAPPAGANLAPPASSGLPAPVGLEPAAVVPALSPAAAAPDLEGRLAKWKPVSMPFAGAGLTPRERRMLDKLIEACHHLESIYWRQSDPEAMILYQSLTAGSPAGAIGGPAAATGGGAAGSGAAEGEAGRPGGAERERNRMLGRLLWINGSRYDLIDENRPFVGRQPMPPGRALFPPGLTRQEIDAYVVAHPEQKAAIYDEHALVVQLGNGLGAVPYHVAWKSFLEPAARALEEAAALSDDAAFANYLRLRARALLTDDYYQSDLAWLDLINPKFDLIFAPYETYLDDLLGVKTSYGAAVLIRNEAESAKLAVFQKLIPELQEALPLDREDRPSKRGRVAPMEVMDAPFRAGDLRHGYQAVADNLPNDPRVHEKKGSKRIFFKNFMDARVREVILPVAKRLMRADQAAMATAEGYLAAVMMHEISHGLGPAFARFNGQKIDIREAIGPTYSGLEEAKADVTGMFGLAWLVDHGALPRERLPEFYASYVAGIFRTVRFGTGEAHGRAEMMEFNYLAEQRAIVRDPAAGRYVIDFALIPGALARLTKELLAIEATGDHARAEILFTKYGTMPGELRSDLAAAGDVPVDIDPQGSFPEGVQ
ncbi:MAG TPA: Zn-dependent hydrolase [Thermoanaerobaculia bacterium]|nr:Zn-dependent hydrolase [Thermoanaerobaculia bacterium]